MGRCKEKLNHRPQHVHLQCVAGADLPIEGPVQPRSAGGFNEPAQSRRVHQLEYDVESGLEPSLESGLEKSSLWIAGSFQRDSLPAYHAAPEVLKYEIFDYDFSAFDTWHPDYTV